MGAELAIARTFFCAFRNYVWEYETVSQHISVELQNDVFSHELARDFGHRCATAGNILRLQDSRAMDALPPPPPMTPPPPQAASSSATPRPQPLQDQTAASLSSAVGPVPKAACW